MRVGSVEPENLYSATMLDGAWKSACAIILSGGLRSSALMQSTGIATLDLYITDRSRVIDHWIGKLGDVMDDPDLVRVVAGHACPTPRLEATPAQLALEPDPYRGPGGVVRDAAHELGKGTVLVLEGARYLDDTLNAIMERHRETSSLATVAMNPDGTPAGIYAIEREAIDLVPSRGFMDLKEQWLPRIQRVGRVEVFKLGGRGALPLRTPQEFLGAARLAALGAERCDSLDSVWVTGDGEHWTVRGPGVVVEDGAHVEDSVLQAGVVVRAGAIVARSIVCEGEVIERAEQVVDRVLRRSSHARRDGSAQGTRP